jgi:protein-tyrosine phosphatase
VLDLHNHVLFGLDDGCRTPEESRDLAAMAKAAGHTGFVATPHIRPGMFNNSPDDIRRRRDEARGIVEGAGLEMYLGAEYYFDENVLASARQKTLLTLGESSRFVLAELPTMQLPPRLGDVIFEIRLAGYVPVIAHPERCRGVQQDVASTLEMFSQAGALLQLDLGSLIGHYGASAKVAALDILKSGAYHVAACDLHRPEDVAQIVSPALVELQALLKRRKSRGEHPPAEQVEMLIDANPRKIIGDAPLEEIQAV